LTNKLKIQSIQIVEPEWKTIGVKVRVSELPNLNRQLDRLSYTTLGDLVKDLIAGKITRLTDDQEIDIMKTNLQANSQITGLESKPYDFYKQIDNFIEEKVKKIFDMPGEIGFIARFGLLAGLREQEIIYIKEKEICSNGYGCDCDSLHKVDCKNGLTIIVIGWTRGNKKALATIIPTKYWERFRSLKKFDYTDIAATHKIMKRDVGIAYIAMRKIHYNIMRFKETLSVDEAEVLAGRFSSVSGRHYVLHDPEKLAEKYSNAWNNFGININHLQDNKIISSLSS
jgi:intergrase/recombinase